MTAKAASASSFADEFLKHYLKNGMGSMSKSDIDSLVMYLLEKYAHNGGVSLQGYSNQTLSETLRAPVSKIKRLRYEAGLKYGGRAEDEARRRFIACLAAAVIDLESKKVVLVIEDALAKNWIQGQIKSHGLVFDNSFNSEIVRVSPEGLFLVLDAVLPDADVKTFRAKYDALAKKKKVEEIVSGFSELAKAFAKGAVGKVGGVVAAGLIGLPAVGG